MNKYQRLTGALLTLFLCFSLPGCKDDPEGEAVIPAPVIVPVDLKLDTLQTGLSRPWSLEFVGHDSILLTDLSGKLTLWNNGSLTEISNVPSFVNLGQGGLLDVRRHPNFSQNKLIYFCGSTGTSSAFSTTLFRARFDGNALTNVEQLFQATPMNSSGAHFGSRIAFDDAGHVFLSLGERNSIQTAQQRSNHNGCVVRLNDDGSIPSDNPFVSEPGAMPEIWTYGHRNVQGMAVEPSSGAIWTHEHGPKGGDEINILEKGANYGWPLASFGVNYNGSEITKDTFVEGTVLPIHYWVPSIAPCGMDFYTSDSIPQWKGDLFIGALAGQHLNRLSFSGNSVVNEERLLQGFGRFRAVRQGPDGYLYFLTEQPGMLLRFRPSN
ncbi:MAG: PQQ-dependent sugar dehydrogenase [Flavobacteriales bacterium]|nr:PQQ-dependent sugar dehydrogenase [Flavobacteriales bacterium]